MFLLRDGGGDVTPGFGWAPIGPGRAMGLGFRSDWSILSIGDQRMRTVSATEAKQKLGALLDSAQREPVVIRRQKRDIAVILSAQEYDRLRAINTAEFERFCDRVGEQAEAAGLTEAKLAEILSE
jgi:prevent-host-death family protein